MAVFVTDEIEPKRPPCRDLGPIDRMRLFGKLVEELQPSQIVDALILYKLTPELEEIQEILNRNL